MNILFVLECAALPTNGTTASCVRFARALEEKGHKVTIIGCAAPNNGPLPHENYVVLRNYSLLVFDPIIHKEGFQFVKVEDDKLFKAVSEADVIHTFLPFKLSSHARLMGAMLGKTVTTAYHLQPDTIPAAIHLLWFRPLTNLLYHAYRVYHYDYIRHVHCPSQMIANEMDSHHYAQNVSHVISNGIDSFWHPVEGKREPQWEGKFVVAMVGRLAKEKRQDLLIRAVRRCKNEKNVQLILCGQGPKKRHYEKMFEKLNFTNKPEIRFLSQENLRTFLSSIDLYVHCSDAEVEGLSCIEAFACGRVPVISDAPLSATHHFALDKQCVFKHGNAASLSHRIDYWYNHPEERKELEKRYVESAKGFALPLQVSKMEQMFLDAKADNDKDPKAAYRALRKKDKLKCKRIYRKLKKKGLIDGPLEAMR